MSLMKKNLFVKWAVLAFLMGGPPLQAQEEVISTVVVQDKQQEIAKLSEAFGNFIGKNLNNPGIHFDIEKLITGIRKGAAGEDSPMSEEEYELALAAIQERAYEEVAQNNLKQAETFLAEKSKSNSIIQVEPGKLQYEILEEGHGSVVHEHASPQIHYTGRLMDGTVFGSSEGMSDPLVIPLDQTISGFSKGLIGMKEGERRRLYVHPEMAYGLSGELPPNSLLIFDVEVVRADVDEGVEEMG